MSNVGYSKLVSRYGKDLMIYRIAGICHSKDDPQERRNPYHGAETITGKIKDNETEDEIRRRIEFLIKNGHFTPFEFCNVTFVMYTPRFVMDQFARHRTAHILVQGGRWNDPADIYTPEGAFETLKKEASWEKKELKTFAKNCKTFNSREKARSFLPMGVYHYWVYQQDLRNFLNMIDLRMAENAQEETRLFAEDMYEQVKYMFPITCEAWEKYKPLTYEKYSKLKENNK